MIPEIFNFTEILIFPSQVEMYGLPIDTVRRGKYKTKTVQNGINPIYDEEPFLFRQVILPDLAVFRIAAFEESGE